MEATISTQQSAEVVWPLLELAHRDFSRRIPRHKACRSSPSTLYLGPKRWTDSRRHQPAQAIGLAYFFAAISNASESPSKPRAVRKPAFALSHSDKIPTFRAAYMNLHENGCPEAPTSPSHARTTRLFTLRLMSSLRTGRSLRLNTNSVSGLQRAFRRRPSLGEPRACWA